jgi:hypothetical protein
MFWHLQARCSWYRISRTHTDNSCAETIPLLLMHTSHLQPRTHGLRQSKSCASISNVIASDCGIFHVITCLRHISDTPAGSTASVILCGIIAISTFGTHWAKCAVCTIQGAFCHLGFEWSRSTLEGAVYDAQALQHVLNSRTRNQTHLDKLAGMAQREQASLGYIVRSTAYRCLQDWS